MPDPVRLLAFSGSARRESLNAKFLTAAVDAARARGAEVTVVSLNDFPMPLYHGDWEDEHGMPEKATALVELIVQHDGLLIASPEYNSMMTPLLKNTIDWCTRGDENPLNGKVAAVLSASPGMFGGIRSQTLVRSLLTHLGCHIVPLTCVLPHADKAFTPEGKLESPKSQESVEKLAAALVDTANRLKSS